MFLVTGPELVIEACKAGVMGCVPRQNAGTMEEFESWLSQIQAELRAYKEQFPEERIGPVAVNLATRRPASELRDDLAVCKRYGVRIIISATGDPSELIREVHDWGGLVFHDVVSMRFAEKAIRAGADGLTCIATGGGGHSGGLSPLVFVPKVRSIFNGTILMAGCIATGGAIRVAEILGADLAYMGTRFIATKEAKVDLAYWDMLVNGTSSDLIFTDKVSGVAANWLITSMQRVGIDLDKLPDLAGKVMRSDHLPIHIKPWRDIWSAGQALDLINDVPSTKSLIARLKSEYEFACSLPQFGDTQEMGGGTSEGPNAARFRQ